ncbi:MAG: urea ABC transporter ATP-binding protein UrtD [Actinomycetota bacterium]|nr:urea ABC transporter ATP-binding protein UrtD [Actinomycetota bacterium]MDQ6945920.1 urea ABC transporter ATP-binding protein UrtD [Actinomycetota bacterium]
MTALLEIRDLEVVFDGFRAIDHLDFQLQEGELRFLIGPNGAGKTTLIDVVTGLTRPAGGSVSFAGTELVGRREHEIVHLGVGRTFQTATVFEELTVKENVDLAATFRMSYRSLLRRARRPAAGVMEALETVELAGLADRRAAVLSHGQRQWLELAMLVVQQPRLLLLDEPVAGMTKEERSRTGELLGQIAVERTVMVVEHDMAFLRQFASTVTVMHEGKVLCEGPLAEVQADPVVQEVYLGRSERVPEPLVGAGFDVAPADVGAGPGSA